MSPLRVSVFTIHFPLSVSGRVLSAPIGHPWLRPYLVQMEDSPRHLIPLSVPPEGFQGGDSRSDVCVVRHEF